MVSSTLRLAAILLSTASILQAVPDISNLKNCIADVRRAENSPPSVPTFDPYTKNYKQLIADLQASAAKLPHVYQEAAAKPLIRFLKRLGEARFIYIFSGLATDQESLLLQQIIPDAVLSILFHHGYFNQGVNAFQEVVSDLYDSFLSESVRVGNQTGRPIEPPTYGIIPPLVKFGNAEFGPYTWPIDATRKVFGMHCAIVSLPESQLVGGLLAWSALGHETAGHDITHADQGLLQELAQRVHRAVFNKFKSTKLANYWAKCIDEASADVLGCLNMGPSAGIGLVGYFRALGNGKLRTIGSVDDTHPISLLRGYLAAAVVKRLHFQGAEEWSQLIIEETNKDRGTLYLINRSGNRVAFPASFENAVASADLVARVIMRSKLFVLQKHSLQDIQDWTDQDQDIVDNLISAFKTTGELPENVQGAGFYAAHVVAAATLSALEENANVSVIFKKMKNFLNEMHVANPTWSTNPSPESLELLEKALKEPKKRISLITPRPVFKSLAEEQEEEQGQLLAEEQEEGQEEGQEEEQGQLLVEEQEEEQGQLLVEEQEEEQSQLLVEEQEELLVG